MTESAPTFSVIMPAFNTEATIGQAIGSVLAQSDPDFELLVVDDGSTDGTAAVAEAIVDPRLRVLRQRNRGAAAARNAGIEASSAPLIALVDSDDLWLPSFLAGMRSQFDADPALGLCYTDAWLLDPATGRIGTATAMQWQRPPVPPPVDPALFLQELLDRNFIYSAAVLRRSVVDELGGFDETLGAAIDYEMWLRIVAHGHRAGSLPGLHAVYRRDRPGSISTNRSRAFASLGAAYRKVADDYPVAEPLRDQARARAEWAAREQAGHDGRGGLDGFWRSRARTALVRFRNRLLRRDGWRRVPPPELVEALPSLFRRDPSS